MCTSENSKRHQLWGSTLQALNFLDFLYYTFLSSPKTFMISFSHQGFLLRLLVLVIRWSGVGLYSGSTSSANLRSKDKWHICFPTLLYIDAYEMKSINTLKNIWIDLMHISFKVWISININIRTIKEQYIFIVQISTCTVVVVAGYN